MKIKTAIILGVVILSIAVYGYLKATPGADSQQNLPKIEITPSSFDFGDVEFGKILDYTFKLKNAGNEILEIKRVATSCGCTKGEINKEKINPGEEAELLVTYDTGAMSGSHAQGKQERIIYVKSNDPVNPQVEVMIKANVK